MTILKLFYTKGQVFLSSISEQVNSQVLVAGKNMFFVPNPAAGQR